jgi:uncharacterized ion transporter superfamily protein YfcC
VLNFGLSGSGAKSSEVGMNYVVSMWCIWGLVVLVYAALRIYVGRLDRDEDDTLLLDDAFAHEKAAQAVIIAKVKKIQPVQRLALIALIVMSLVVIVYYIWNAVEQFQ